MQKKLEVTSFVSEIKRVENYPDFEKLAHVIQHGLEGLIVKITKMSQRRQTILVLFVEVGLLRKSVQISPTFSQNLILQKAYETIAPRNEKLNRT